MPCPIYNTKTPIVRIKTDIIATRISGKAAIKPAIRINVTPGR